MPFDSIVFLLPVRVRRLSSFFKSAEPSPPFFAASITRLANWKKAPMNFIFSEVIEHTYLIKCYLPFLELRHGGETAQSTNYLNIGGQNTSMKYQVDVGHVKKIQRSIWNNIKSTFSFRKGYGEPVPVYGHYGGIFKCGDENLVIHTDGVGTKLLVAQSVGRYNTVGIDAVAMSVNDILCVGAEPLVGVDYIALAEEDDVLVGQIMEGLVKGAEESSCAIVGGETAIIPDIVKGGEKPFDLTFTAVGRIKKMILGNEIAKGDVMVGLESSGLHSNGYTLARNALDSGEWGEEMLVPTRIYANPLLETIDACDVHGIAHITGGAFSKLTRLNKDVGYRLDNLPAPKPIFKAIQERVKSVKEMYRTFNMGIGMVVVLPEDRAGTLINIAKKHGIEADTIGKIIEKKGVWMDYRGKEMNLSI
ncbi:phosphoribosylformylglycinamidine cyclo-ligase [Candidatus Micrarchaeota archaeon]|nr:phosphoribosylformylglycinamidine cyclo-ligase [Candidatus Micrarchaeota archaeon]